MKRLYEKTSEVQSELLVK